MSRVRTWLLVKLGMRWAQVVLNGAVVETWIDPLSIMEVEP